MSIWTQVCGAIDVEADRECEENLNKFISELQELEEYRGEIEFYVNKLGGYNTSIGMDCKNCKYGDSVKRVAKGTYQCDAPNDFECPSANYQTRCIVSIVGSLRYYSVNDIRDDMIGILKKFDETFFVRKFVVHMDDYYGEEIITRSDLR